MKKDANRISKTGLRPAELDAVLRSWHVEMSRMFATVPSELSAVQRAHDRLREILREFLEGNL